MVPGIEPSSHMCPPLTAPPRAVRHGHHRDNAPEHDAQCPTASLRYTTYHGLFVDLRTYNVQHPVIPAGTAKCEDNNNRVLTTIHRPRCSSDASERSLQHC
ncbi:hypothetical protein BDV38DRAFT_235170 [Aspergillus pseudotamarii]|uniref:Uncharacterized protein n=1 Tax=Aspergillus pseudotamarii TaxID=132259 RepID=A0A5N6T8S7_ASPPS|nr:uncharacterized protein BDV38DRAFT_235170 [Aspergillus pseudotamarii]KAE8142579.1 hypothetical protein BDV38DRAFT_235170 [Aspergillus pseudotamarii]